MQDLIVAELGPK